MGSDPWVERRLTASLARKFDRGDKRVLIGIGDDGAVVRTTSRTVVTCDPVVEGVHFEGSTPPHLIGRKAVNRNLSDLAAMGARPTFLVVSILFPGWLDPAGRQQLFRGIRDAARSADCTVVGGDVARTEGLLVVTVTALGEAPRRPLTRAGLRVGDSVHVSGPLGGSALGHHLRFSPRIQIGRWLAGQRAVTAAIDISDGLLIDLATVLEASGGLGAVLDVATLPITTAARRAAETSERDALCHVLSDGEDHELLFGVRGPLEPGGPLTARARRPVGEVTAIPGIQLRHRDGSCEPCGLVGYQHDV